MTAITAILMGEIHVKQPVLLILPAFAAEEAALFTCRINRAKHPTCRSIVQCFRYKNIIASYWNRHRSSQSNTIIRTVICMSDGTAYRIEP